MHSKRLLSYNPFFLIPLLIWLIVGGWLLSSYSAKDLFYAVNSRHNATADIMMFYVTELGEGFIIILVLLLIMIIPRFRNWWYFVSALLCNLLPFFVQQGLKSYFDAPRPINYFKHAAWIHQNKDWPELLYRSFPSGHTEGAFCFFCFLAILLPEKYRSLGLLFFILALAVAYSRLYLAAHFFADVYVGSIVGAVLCTLIHFVMEMLKSRYLISKNNTI